ncbi:multidrug resistance-associated protein 1 isoform X2 [Bradysia coprophila]|uniref:multidrug resistance-associated protein 1 isoform X2 n=1 Tax=Bradysia coprophila TaxID=38358 RepID=UPI00187D97AE|nr:multidrug resistance-associated protein 1 isoform X2 [Bradysia coprophila]
MAEHHPMDDFCGSEFWNVNTTWRTDNPDFTVCFQRTVLVWTPCAVLWVFSLLDIFYIRKAMNRNVPWNALNVSKLIGTGALILLTIVDLCMAASRNSEGIIFPVDIYTPIIKIVSFLYAGVLLVCNKKNGLRTSGLLFLFWFSLFICSIPQCRSEVRLRAAREAEGEKNSWAEYNYISFMIFFTLTTLVWLLNWFADSEPLQTKYPRTQNPCPETQSSFISKMFFAWFDKMAWKGYRNPLEHKDLWDMNPEDTSKEVMPLFAKYWNQSVQKAAGVKSNETLSGGKAEYTKASSTVNITRTKGEKKASILPAICKAFGPTFLFGSVLKLVQDVLTFVSPQILRLIIQFVDPRPGEEQQEFWKGLLYAFLLFIVASVQTLILAQYFQRMFVVGLRIRTALISAVYRKALIMSNSSRKESTVGEIVNLMAVDAQRFMDLTTYINMLWSAPLQIGLALYFLWAILGASVLAGLAVMIILIPVNGFIANKIKTLQIRQMKNKDERVKLMNEVLSGIKVLKLYAWEPSFENQVLKIRDKEIKVLREAAYLNAGTSFIWSCAPFLVALVTFAVFVLVDEKNVLDAEIAFVSLSLFNILRFPLSMLPMLITNMVQTSVSVKRLNKFMNCEELDPENVQHDPKESSSLVVENGTFSWGEEETVLKNINFKVDKGNLAAVVGTVGSGKSSLLSALLGEMEKISGRVNTVGKIAYVSQQAWIQNCTLQDNILFGKPLDQKRYQQVVAACALKPDIDMLPGGDQTEIGEKGINLSGGQKQRVSLARAVYNDADIYLMDDPLSAVDSHVGKHIFEEVIGPGGLLDKKTRVLVTHGIVYLPKVDNIFVLKSGEVSESGNYEALMNKKGAFAEFLLQHLQEITPDHEEMETLKEQLENTLGADDELMKQLEHQISRRSESVSETDSMNGSLSRQVSQSSETSLRKRSVSKEKDEPKPKPKDTLIEKEHSEVGSVKWAVYKHYLKSIGVTLTILTILLNLVFQGFSIGSNVWLSRWSNDKNVANDTSLRDMYLGVYGAFGFGQALSSYMNDLAPQLGCLLAAIHFHKVLLHGVVRAPLTFFDTTPTGRILSRFSKDVDVLDTGLSRQISDTVFGIFEVIATLVVISISTYIFVAVIIPIGILYYFVQRFYVATSRQLKRLESVSRSPIYSHFGESIQGAQTIRAYTVQDRFINESEDKVDFNQVCYYPSIIANRWLAVRLEMVGNLIILFAALFAILSRETMDAGTVGLSVSYALQITQTLNWLVRMTSEVETNIVAVERIKEYGETKQEAAWDIPSQTLPKNWPESGTVEFKNFQVRYREGLELVLKGISFTVAGGQKVGIVGRTGAGKSSLTLALFRIIESSGGSILIDGHDISKLGLHALRSRLTIIPQDPVLFSGTLRLNLDPFEHNSDEEVWTALEHAHLKVFVKGLTAGLNHEITEGGENLSVGQRQLVCLARALLRKTKVLILDEATAAVDLETDDLIQNTIRTEFSECTVLTIAHRLNTIMDSDKVIVLDRGQIAEFAAPSELLQNKKSAFYSMAKDAGLV